MWPMPSVRPVTGSRYTKQKGVKPDKGSRETGHADPFDLDD